MTKTTPRKITATELRTVLQITRTVSHDAHRLVNLMGSGRAVRRNSESLSFSVPCGPGRKRLFESFPASALREAIRLGLVKARKLDDGLGHVEATQIGRWVDLHVGFGPRGGRITFRLSNDAKALLAS